MLKKILLAIVAIVAAVLGYAATRPDTFALERSTVIDAPPAVVYAQLDDFHKWSAWSPWEKMDPGMKRTYSGAASGVGAMYAWEGNSAVGQGKMQITDSAAPNKLTVALDFVTPIEAHNVVEFALTPQDTMTRVRWSMHGENGYLAKVMQLFVSMDSMVGKDFESGLTDLKAAAERIAAASTASSQP